jgi:hypothetical protein
VVPIEIRTDGFFEKGGIYTVEFSLQEVITGYLILFDFS